MNVSKHESLVTSGWITEDRSNDFGGRLHVHAQTGWSRGVATVPAHTHPLQLLRPGDVLKDSVNLLLDASGPVHYPAERQHSGVSAHAHTHTPEKRFRAEPAAFFGDETRSGSCHQSDG